MKVWLLIIHDYSDKGRDFDEVHVYSSRSKIIDDFKNGDYNMPIDDDQVEELDREGVFNNGDLGLTIVEKEIN